MKPTYGRCSRWGIVAFASSLDQAGPIARTVRDTALLMRSMAGHDPKDTTSVDLPVPDYEAALGRSVKGMKIGIPKEYRLDGMPGEIETLWQQGIAWLKDAGAEMVDVSLPHTKYALPAYYIVAPAEASSNLARYDGVRYGLRVPGRDIIGMYEGTRAQGFGKEVRRRVMIGTYVLSAGYYDAYYIRAQKVRTLIKKDFEDCFAKGIDAMLTPATPSAAFAIGEKGGADPVEMYLNDVFTVTVNMAGLPGIAVPAGLDRQGLPLGLQLIGKAFDEETLFALGQKIEDAAGHFSGGAVVVMTPEAFRASVVGAAPPDLTACAAVALVGREGRLGQGAQDRHGRRGRGGRLGARLSASRRGRSAQCQLLVPHGGQAGAEGSARRRVGCHRGRDACALSVPSDCRQRPD